MEQLASKTMETDSFNPKPPQNDESTLKSHFSITFTHHSIIYIHIFIQNESKTQIVEKLGKILIFEQNWQIHPMHSAIDPMRSAFSN